MADDWENTGIEEGTEGEEDTEGDEGTEEAEGAAEEGEVGEISVPLITTVRKIQLMNGEEELILPITPESYEITDNWANEELNINQLGLITMIGKRGLKSITISSFFPAQEYDFLVPGSTTEDCNPWAMVKKLLDWRGAVLTLFISDTYDIVSWPCVIDGDFIYGERDASGDVYYTITFKEYKKTNSERKVKEGGGEGGIKFPYTTRLGDTLNQISTQYCGSTKYAKTLFIQNKVRVKASFKEYKHWYCIDKKAKQRFKRKSKYDRPLMNGTKIVLYLVKQRD